MEERKGGGGGAHTIFAYYIKVVGYYAFASVRFTVRASILSEKCKRF